MNFFKTTLSSILGSIIGGGIIVLILILFISGLFSPKDPEIVIEEPVFLKMELKAPILEKSDGTPYRMQGLSLPEFGSGLGLYEITKALEAASEDEKIAGIYLRIRNVNGGWEKITTLRESLLAFKSSGKKIIAWSDGYDERSLYLASAADEIYLHPQGDFELNGFAATPYYIRGMLDKFNLEVNTFRVGTHKSGTEMYTETEMSPANREQLGFLLGDLWGSFQDSISASRNLTKGQIEAFATDPSLTTFPIDAARRKLITEVKTEPQILDMIREELEAEQNEPTPLLSFRKYMNARVRPEPLENDEDKIAVIFLEGDIVMGDGGSGQIGGDRFVREIRKAHEDSTVKAIVLRINSPGGSSLASDLMAEEIYTAVAKKPVIASMGDVAASGGYYIAAPCNAIFARPQTITGSIGVYALTFQTHGLLENEVGITYDRVTTHPMADMNSPDRPMTEAEKALMQKSVENTYDRFLDLVKSREAFAGTPRAEVDSLAQGKVWSGKRAKELRLVDHLGGLEDAIAYAKQEANLDDAQLWILPAPDNTFQQLASALSVLKVDAALLGPELQTELARLQEARDNHWKPGIYMRMDMDLDIR